MHNITENMIPGTVQKRGRGKPQVQGQNNMGKMATNLWNGGQLFSAKLKVEKLTFWPFGLRNMISLTAIASTCFSELTSRPMDIMNLQGGPPVR